MLFFNDCKTKQETTTLFRKLSKFFHPDMGGENEYMIELIKQYDAWNPENVYTNERIVYQTSFNINPRVGILERELARLQQKLKNPVLERENSKLKSTVEHLRADIEHKNNLLRDFSSKIESVELYLKNQIDQLKINKEESDALIKNLIQENIYLKEKELKEAVIPVQLTLWQKIKYVIGNKYPKSYI